MKEKNITSFIKNKKQILDLKPVIAIYGNENFLKKQFISILRENSEKDFHILWGDETTLEDLENILSSGSLFSKGNTVVLLEADNFLDTLSKKEIEKLNLLLRSLNSPNNTLVFVLNK
ncbi:MAG: hypothetical protein GXO21_03085, partial [Aquificae bacterium]|nr:hypothetical protein [Aquificota bacterium]